MPNRLISFTITASSSTEKHTHIFDMSTKTIFKDVSSGDVLRELVSWFNAEFGTDYKLLDLNDVDIEHSWS